MDTRTCQVCNQTLPITRFRNAGFGRHKTCIPCVDAKRAETVAAKKTPPAPRPRRRPPAAPWEWTHDTTLAPGQTVTLPAGWRTPGTPS